MLPRAHRRHTLPRRLAAVAATAAASAVLAAISVACGSDEVRTDGEATPSTMSMDRWSSAIEDVCGELDERFDELPDAELRSTEDAVEHADAVEAYAARLESAASRLTDMSVDRSAIAEFETLAGDLSDAAASLARATRDGDTGAAADAVEEIEVAGSGINELASELSLDGCDGF